MAWREDSDLEFNLILPDIPVIKLDIALVVHPVRRPPMGISIKEQKKACSMHWLYKKFPDLYRLKIQPAPAWDYYLIVRMVILFVTGLFTYKAVMLGFGISIGILFARLIIRRLSFAPLAFNHVLEMIATSLVIPFASVYWQS